LIIQFVISIRKGKLFSIKFVSLIIKFYRIDEGLGLITLKFGSTILFYQDITLARQNFATPFTCNF